MTVIENAALVKEIAPNPLSSHDRLRAVGLADHMHSFPSELPGGERRKTQIGTFKALGFRDRLSVGGRMLQGTAADALRPYPPKRMKQLRAEETRRFKALNFGAKLLPVIAAVALGIVALCSLA